ncbi:MAG: hypothetical protein IPN88_16765 [Bacteroidetes bacterium]|nr:hypothetical protein [Bacteroidota bacterium]
MYIIKTDSFGDTLWTKAYGGADLDYGYYVEQTIDSGYIISGSTIVLESVMVMFISLEQI